MLATIPLKHITEGTRLRSANDAQVAALVASIRDVGILNPITVYPRKVMVDHIAVDGYGIVAGLHRYTACKELGLIEIPANIVTLSELERQIAECDENLCGPKLTPAQKSLFMQRRKEAYEALHPETKHGAVGGGHDQSRKLCDSVKPAERFTADTALKTGQSERAVQLSAERGSKIDADVLEAITGTHLDSGAYQDELKKLTKVEQRAKVRADLDKKKKDEDRARKQDGDSREAKVAAEWLVGIVGRENIIALITTLESVPLKKLCAELRRA